MSEPTIKKWLSNYPEDYRRSKLRLFSDFHRFLQADERFRGLSPAGLVEFQREAVEKGDEFVLLDVLQDYIKGKSGTYSSLVSRYSTIRGFFKKNRAPLPSDDFRIHADREPNGGRLSIDVIKSLVESSGLGRKAFYLTVWMSLMDLERFCLFNEGWGARLTEHLKEYGVDTPFKFEFLGRKESRGKTQHYTFIGGDALAALKEYFERMRGYPGKGEPIIIDREGRAMSKWALRIFHLRQLEKLKYIRRGGARSNRYGYNIHEFRDVAKTLLHLQGKGDGLDMECVTFWMGHVTDPNKYDKFYMDKEYVLKHYRIAEKYLNIMSGSRLAEMPSVDRLIRSKGDLVKLAEALEDYGFIIAKKQQ